MSRTPSTRSTLDTLDQHDKSVPSLRDSFRSPGSPYSSSPRRSTSAAPSHSSRSSCASKSSQRSWDEDDEFDQVLHAIEDDLNEHIRLLKVPRMKSLFNGKSSSQSRIEEDARRVLKRMRSDLGSKLGTFGGATEEMPPNNTGPHHLHDHRAALSDCPEPYTSLDEEPSSPPTEDMNQSDPELVPCKQESRFDGDLYTPKWVRGYGKKREGWCGICKPGRWLVLDSLVFWYDKSFRHGISAGTGQPFNEPKEIRRMDGLSDIWEGLCGSCHDWIALDSSKEKCFTWFRHTYKCHNHHSRDDQFTTTSPDEEMHGKAFALFDFERENENELPLVEGQMIWISYRYGQGWLVAEDPETKERGLVPEEYVRLFRGIESAMASLTGQAEPLSGGPSEEDPTPKQAEHTIEDERKRELRGICYAQLLTVRDEVVQELGFLKKAAITSRLESADVERISLKFEGHGVSVANISSKMQGSFNARHGLEHRLAIPGNQGPQQPNIRTSQQSTWFTTDGVPIGPPKSQARTMITPDRMRRMYMDAHRQQQGPFTSLEMNEGYRDNY